MAEKDYSPILDYFETHPFGSEMPILTLLSTLPPADRIKIISIILENNPNNIEAYSKLSMAFLKDGNPDSAYALLERGKDIGIFDDYTHTMMAQKLDSIKVQLDEMREHEVTLRTEGVNIPAPASTLADTRTTLTTSFSSIDLNGGEAFLNILLDFCNDNIDPISILEQQQRRQAEYDSFPAMNIDECDRPIEKKPFLFNYHNVRVWEDGKCIINEDVTGYVDAVLNEDSLSVLVAEKLLDGYVLDDFEFFQISENIDRIMWTKDIYNASSITTWGDPTLMSLFFKEGKLSRIYLTINQPEVLIEFNGIELDEDDLIPEEAEEEDDTISEAAEEENDEDDTISEAAEEENENGFISKIEINETLPFPSTDSMPTLSSDTNPLTIDGKINTDAFYEQALNELEQDSAHKATWAKAFMEKDGDDAKAKALYIKRRVEKLTEEAQDFADVQDKELMRYLLKKYSLRDEEIELIRKARPDLLDIINQVITASYPGSYMHYINSLPSALHYYAQLEDECLMSEIGQRNFQFPSEEGIALIVAYKRGLLDSIF